jgi:hypothetical protein
MEGFEWWVEYKDDLVITPRASWDEYRQWIVGQYAKTIWDNHEMVVGKKLVTVKVKQTVVRNGKNVLVATNKKIYEDVVEKRKVNVMAYTKFWADGSTRELRDDELYEVYRRIVVHHTAQSTVNKSAKEQVREVRNIHIGAKKFNDIGYNFIIASDWTIFEWRSLHRVGAHAWETKESELASKEWNVELEDLIYANSFTKNKNNNGHKKYMEYLKRFDQALRKDPDYGSLGIALCGDFSWTQKPTAKQ